MIRPKRPLRPLRPTRPLRGRQTAPLPKPRYPHALELAYHGDLMRTFVDPTVAIVHARALDLARKLDAAIEAHRPARADAAGIGDPWSDARWESDVDEWVADTRITLAERVSIPDVMRQTAVNAARQVDAFNAADIRRTVERVKPVDPFRANPRLQAAQNTWTAQNVKLIGSIPETHAERVGAMIKQAVASSTRAGGLAKRLLPSVQEGLQAEAGICGRRAMLIARTEIAKQFGELTQIRQQAAGIDSYTWATAHDDRVRPTHRAHDGHVFRWSEPPADTGHPGNDYNCRCVAVAVI